MAQDISKSKLLEVADKYVSEYLNCKSNFDYFCRHYIKVELPGRDVIIQPYRKQVELVDLIEREKYVLVLKSRQIGILNYYSSIFSMVNYIS